MTTFRIIWEIDIDADSHQEAAKKALEYQQDPESTAKHFTVVDLTSGTYMSQEINLNPGE